jgi:hypothetical protein
MSISEEKIKGLRERYARRRTDRISEGSARDGSSSEIGCEGRGGEDQGRAPGNNETRGTNWSDRDINPRDQRNDIENSGRSSRITSGVGRGAEKSRGTSETDTENNGRYSGRISRGESSKIGSKIGEAAAPEIPVDEPVKRTRKKPSLPINLDEGSCSEMISILFEGMVLITSHDHWHRDKAECASVGKSLAELLKNIPADKAEKITKAMPPISFAIGMVILAAPSLEIDSQLKAERIARQKKDIEERMLKINGTANDPKTRVD